MLSVWWDGAVRALLAAAGVVLLPVLWVPNFLDTMTRPALLGWDVLALVFLSRQLWIMRRGRVAPDTEGAPKWLPSARWMRPRFGALLVASAAGLSSGLLIVSIDIEETGDWYIWIIRLLAATTVILAWLILHAGYAMHYANIYFASGHGIKFPGTEKPNFLDFAYFAFTIGATFATSDVEVTNRRIRHAVIWHSVLSFFYNAAVLGIAIGAFTGK
ncbi:DUF1345 domain-containing protein [Kribbella sp. NPDC005582]|uniref:DUF1345 domain-containing protein n=1 Tax=Kribbella sp. NPDC005582 TaxID=3156893 RepID=UPI0033BCABDE